METVAYWKLIVLFLSVNGTETITTDFYTEDACLKAADWVVTVSSGNTDRDVFTQCLMDTPPAFINMQAVAPEWSLRPRARPVTTD